MKSLWSFFFIVIEHHDDQIYGLTSSVVESQKKKMTNLEAENVFVWFFHNFIIKHNENEKQ